MQTKDEYNLPKRSRYYHSIIDADKLLKAGVKFMQLEEMIAEERAEERKKNSAEIARKMKDMGLTDEQIEEATGVKASEIE